MPSLSLTLHIHPSPNPEYSTFKIYSDSKHFSLPPWLPPGPSHHHLLPRLLKEPPPLPSLASVQPILNIAFRIILPKSIPDHITLLHNPSMLQRFPISCRVKARVFMGVFMLCTSGILTTPDLISFHSSWQSDHCNYLDILTPLFFQNSRHPPPIAFALSVPLA